jgi:hypothetical protein
MSGEEIKITPYNPNWFPPCFESKKQCDQYMYMIRRVGQPMDSNNYCMDCTKEYKARMISEGRCSHPETKFITWRTNYKDLNTVGRVISNLNAPDVIGISNVSLFWDGTTID